VSPRLLRYALAWAVAAVVAVAVGIFAVTSAGAGVRDRGQLGTALPAVAGTPSADPSAQRQRADISDAFGVLVVECRGAVAYGVDARPDEAAGWQVVSYEQGPDDDIDAVFANGPRSIEVEVFCNRGRPTVSDREEHVLED
jgi:hypothetical protein